MCGIYLFTKKNNLNLKSKDFLQLLKHRGPDFQKFYQDNHIEMGHTLLSIRDKINNSIQPVITDNGRYIISFNGQIYKAIFQEDATKEFLERNNLTETVILKSNDFGFYLNKKDIESILSTQ